MRSLALLLSAVALVLSGSCPKVKCIQGTTQMSTFDSYALLTRLSTNGGITFDYHPQPVVTTEAKYCVLAYSQDCQISAFGSNTPIGNIAPGQCGYHNLRIHCVCNDANNCNNDPLRWNVAAAATSAVNQGFVGFACPGMDFSALPQPQDCKPDGASQKGLWTGIASLAALAIL